MKKMRITTLLLTIIMMCGVMLSACAEKGEDFETFLKSNPEEAATIYDTAEAYGMDVSISGNEITMTYDLTDLGVVTEENAKDSVFISSLENSLSDDSQFAEACKSLKDASGYDVSMTVNLTYNGETLVSKTYTAADAE